MCNVVKIVALKNVGRQDENVNKAVGDLNDSTSSKLRLTRCHEWNPKYKMLIKVTSYILFEYYTTCDSKLQGLILHANYFILQSPLS